MGAFQTITFQAPPPNIVNPSIQLVGQVGVTQYFYWIVAHYPIGTTTSSTPAFISNAPSTLDDDNNIIVFWDNADGVENYDVIRTTEGTFPTTAGDYAVATGVTNSPVTDKSTTLEAFDPTSLPGLPFGSPVSRTISLNNRDYPQPTLLLPGETSVGILVFPDGSTLESGSGGGSTPPVQQTPWTSDIDGAGHSLSQVPSITLQLGANTAQLKIEITGGFTIISSQPLVISAVSYSFPNMPTTQPAPGSGQLWADPEFSNTVKWEP